MVRAAWREQLSGVVFRIVALLSHKGLLYGLLWFYTPAAIEHCKTEGLRLIGWIHIGLAVSVVVGFLIFFSV
jgi:hypothetical protein